MKARKFLFPIMSATDLAVQFGLPLQAADKLTFSAVEDSMQVFMESIVFTKNTGDPTVGAVFLQKRINHGFAL